MTPSALGASARLKARIAGVLYLGTIVFGLLDLKITEALVVHGDAAATSANILASEGLFRLGFVAELLGGAAYVGVTAILYGLLKPVSQTLSLTAAFFSLTGCAVGAASAVNLLAPAMILGGAPYLSAFRPEQLQAMALTSLRLHAQGYTISMVFFGVYCLLLGVLAYRSTFLPRFLGVMLALAGVGWLTGTLAGFLAPPVADALTPFCMMAGFAGEGSLMLWLLGVGVNGPKWQLRAQAAQATAA